MSNGVLIVLNGGTASGTSGGGYVVSSGVVALQPGHDPLLHPSSGLVLNSGGQEYVLSGGLVFDTIINNRAQQDVNAGAVSGTVINSGGFQLLSGGAAYGTVINSGGHEYVEAGGYTGSGYASGGTAYDTTIGTDGTLALYQGGVLSGGLVFAGSGAVLQDDDTGLFVPPAPLPVISGFAAGDTIQLENFFATGTPTLSGDVLTVSSGIGDISLTFASTAGESFATAPDPNGGTDITVTPLCFLPGTRIATPAGEVAVEALNIGELVSTLHAGPQAVKWIGRRRYGAQFVAGNHLMLPICILASAIGDGVPARDLWISPGHAIHLDGALVPAARLINNVTIFQGTVAETLDYYHIELETHELLLAEGCAAESFYDEDFRNQFQNVAEYHALYPAARPASGMCLPRMEDGFALHAIHRRLAARAGLPATAPIHGPLRGFIDQPGPGTITGWAQCETQPEEPVCLDIFLGGTRIARILANRYREDLRRAGLGSGNHSFAFTLPAGVSGAVDVRRAVDGAPLCRAAAALAA
jgi:autotransporter passenger strand-loop-strand repeat protein